MIWNRLALVVVSILFLGANGNHIQAQIGPNPGKNKGNKNQQNPVHAELHSAKQLLDSANHDYAGHRATAAHEVSLALHLLNNAGGTQGKKANGGAPGGNGNNGGNGPKAGKKNNGNNPAKAQKNNNAKAGQGKMTEPQAVSDAQLKQAAQIITVAMGQLPPAQVQAKTHLQSALREISTALTIR